MGCWAGSENIGGFYSFCCQAKGGLVEQSRAGAEAFEMMILDDDVISAHI